jgi:hypothetical protein
MSIYPMRLDCVKNGVILCKAGGEARSLRLDAYQYYALVQMSVYL